MSFIKTSDSELARAMSRDWLKNFIACFAPAIRRERVTGQTASAAMVDGLAGVTALIIMGRHGSKDEVIAATVASLREAIERDLAHLGSHVRPPQTSN